MRHVCIWCDTVQHTVCYRTEWTKSTILQRVIGNFITQEIPVCSERLCGLGVIHQVNHNKGNVIKTKNEWRIYQPAHRNNTGKVSIKTKLRIKEEKKLACQHTLGNMIKTLQANLSRTDACCTWYVYCSTGLAWLIFRHWQKVFCSVSSFAVHSSVNSSVHHREDKLLSKQGHCV